MLLKKIEIRFGKGRNIMGKGENAGYKHFLPLCFQKALSAGSFKVGKSFNQ